MRGAKDICTHPGCKHERELHKGGRMAGDPPTSCSVFGCPCGGFRESDEDRRRRERAAFDNDTSVLR